MKTRFPLPIMLCMVFGILIAGCNNGNGEEYSSFIGIWQREDVKIYLNADLTVLTKEDGIDVYKGSYAAFENGIEIQITHEWDEDAQEWLLEDDEDFFTASILPTGKLSITDAWDGINGEYVKE